MSGVIALLYLINAVSLCRLKGSCSLSVLTVKSIKIRQLTVQSINIFFDFKFNVVFNAGILFSTVDLIFLDMFYVGKMMILYFLKFPS